jgi:hypothetical protein
MVTWTWYARGFACHFDTWRPGRPECDGQFDDDRSHLRAADGLAAVCAVKPIVLGNCEVLCLVSSSHNDLEPRLSPAPTPVTKFESSGSCLPLHIPPSWCRPVASAGHIGGNPHHYDHSKFDEFWSRSQIQA